jgi:hypothetical protein
MLKAMARCSPLGDAPANAMEVENIDEAAIATKLECAFGENPGASDCDITTSGRGFIDQDQLERFLAKREPNQHR